MRRSPNDDVRIAAGAIREGGGTAARTDRRRADARRGSDLHHAPGATRLAAPRIGKNSIEEMVEACRLDDGNPGLELGERMGQGWKDGRDKVQVSPVRGGFGLWVEQLIAESTGKQGKGLVPVPVDEPADGSDRQSEEARVTSCSNTVRVLIVIAPNTSCRPLTAIR